MFEKGSSEKGCGSHMITLKLWHASTGRRSALSLLFNISIHMTNKAFTVSSKIPVESREALNCG